MSEITILHLSDLHIKEGDSYARDVVLNALVDSLRNLPVKERKPDLIAVTGDIAYCGKEYGA
jgi:3',5'-cyclic AMP phosphodiesterase CpdA